MADRDAADHRYKVSAKGREARRRYDRSLKGYLKRRERNLLKERARLEKEMAWLESQTPTNC